MPVDASLVAAVETFTATLLARDHFNASRAAIGLVECACRLVGADRFDRMVLISALKTAADELEGARRIIH
jgi:hypothetical protein